MLASAWAVSGLAAGLLAAAILSPTARFLAGENRAGLGRCPHCGAPLRPLAHLPLARGSRLGACRSCGAAGREGLWLDVATVIGTALLFVLRPGPGLPEGLLVLWLGLVAAAVDLRCRLIPNRLLLVGGVLGLVALLPLGAAAYVAGLAGGLLLLAVGFAIAWLGRGGFGLGDVKYLALLGLLLGWRRGLATLVLAVLAGGIYAAWLLASRRATRADAFAFGPFIALGSVVVVLAGSGAAR